MDSYKKLRGSIVHGRMFMFAKMPWPLGGIEIYSDKIIFSALIYKIVVAKESLSKITLADNTLSNQFNFFYINKDGKEKSLIFSPLTKDLLLQSLKDFNYFVI